MVIFNVLRNFENETIYLAANLQKFGLNGPQIFLPFQIVFNS